MSDAYETRLVDSGGTTYERVAIAVVIGSLAAFSLGATALFEWIPIDGSVTGASTATYFGAALLALGAAIGVLGVLSRWGGVRTTPDRSVGLGDAAIQFVLWTITTGAIASNTLGLDAVGWLLGVPIGGIVGYLTLVAREDISATLPVAAFVCFVGVVVTTGVIAPSWTWEPSGFDAVIPGRLVIPLLTMVGGLFAGRASAAAYAGFGTRGRQNGAFLLISLVVLLTLSVLAFLLVFVFERGITVVLENLTVGAGTALLLVVAALASLVRSGRLDPATADGTDKLLSFVALAVGSALALAGAALAFVIVRGRSVSGYAVTIEPTTVIGAAPGVLVGAIGLAMLRRSRSPWVPTTERGRTVARGLRVAVGAMIVTAFLELGTGGELAIGGIAVVPTIAFTVAGVAVVAAGVHAATRLAVDRSLPAWVPPLPSTGTLALWAFVVVCLHGVVTGNSFGGAVGINGSGTIDWPFLMNPSQGLGIQKGVMPALVGTVWIVLGAVVFAVPLAVGAAVFLTEYAENSRFTQAVDIATNGLWSTPSIVFGLFGLAFLVPRFGDSPSIFVAQLVLGFMLLPLVLITSREAMKSVPDEYRDASAALGVSKWDTIRSVVIPASMPGVITGAILGVGRIAGETAPLLLVLNGPNFPNASPRVLAGFTVDVGLRPPFLHVSNPALLERASALPYQLYAVITAGVGAEESFGWGTTLVLLGVVLAFYAMGIASRRYFRSKLHQ
ncbi:phosphate ABC transporter permease PstA [Natrinema longum]|uniref:Phosphate transport system permease protein PstA n=1 Tax=Natrinema longum TaxID=370324 RepID=A0A8A2U8J3_9EURY|nr:phosphate ABC transporter permease PstA [Natrinema longum]MBZ6494115.1 phosphate ABC transporter permease PstA [Natrinema longum]QSW84555.1 phosphate ABC transporter permease PstA [Natrinema longum]